MLEKPEEEDTRCPLWRGGSWIHLLADRTMFEGFKPWITHPLLGLRSLGLPDRGKAVDPKA